MPGKCYLRGLCAYGMETMIDSRFGWRWGWILLSLVGCARSPLVPVKGELSLEGGPPLEDFMVLFMPASDNKRPAYGKADSEGKFELMTFRPGDGAFPGEYKVIVVLPSSGLPQAGPANKKEPPKKSIPVIHANYLDAQKTPLYRLVPAEGEIRLELKKTGPSFGVRSCLYSSTFFLKGNEYVTQNPRHRVAAGVHPD